MINSRSDDASAMELERLEDDASANECDRCGDTVRVGRFSRRSASGRRTTRLQLCAPCIARALDKVTGYNVSAQMARWDTFSSNAVELAERSHRSARARRQTREQRAGQKRRIEGGW